MAPRSIVIREVLDTEANEAVPADVDLWPAISAAVASPRFPGRTTSVLGALRVSRPAALRIGAAVALAAIILVAGLPWLGRDQGAAAVLNELAGVAVLQPAPVPATAPGYRYTKTDSMYLSMTGTRDGQMIAALVPKIRTMWIAPDGSGRIREIAGEMVFLSERARSAWQASGSPNLGGAINQDFGAQGLSFEDLSRLPTDPSALATVIRERAQRSDPPLYDEMFVVVGDLLREQTAPPQVRAALYKVAAGIPGVELVGQVRDRAGRQGVAVAKTSTYAGVKRHTLIFDPRTSALLAEEYVLLEPVNWIDAKPPVVVGYATYLESGIVESLPRE